MLRSGCCVFGAYSKNPTCEKWANDVYDQVECLILLHVDDILYIGSTYWETIFLDAISCYDHGAVECLSVGQPIIYCRMKICQTGGTAVSVSQQDFYSNLSPLDASAIVQNGKFVGNDAKRGN